MMPLDRAESRLTRAAKPLKARQMPIERARGLQLGRAIAAPVDLPPTSLSAEDGFAVRAEDAAEATPLFPAVLAVVGEGGARARRRSALVAGKAIRVSACDPMPPGSDTVIPAEGAREREDGKIEVLAPTTAGDHVISRGSELRRGESLFRRGHDLAAEDLGLLATMGVTSVLAYPRPRVGLAFVGAGRVLPGHKPGPGEVTEGNLVTLAAAVEGAGATATSLGLWPLEAREVKAAIARHTRLLDLLVVSGGVSPPGSNFLAGCLEEAGGKTLIPEILVTPGRACLVETVGKCLVIALPGDPRGTLVGLHLLVLAAIHRMSGRREPYIQWDEARLASPVRNCSDLPRLLPGRIQAAAGGGFAVIPEHERKLGSLLGVPGMNGFILLPPGYPNQVAGARVKIARFCR